MLRPRFCFILAALLAAPSLAWAGPPDKADPPAPRDAKAMAARIDQLLAERWAARGVKPAPSAADAEFLRRTYIDLVGRVPPVSEVRWFLDDPRSDKRERLIERLLASPGYVTHMTNTWRAMLLAEAEADQRLGYLRPGFEGWLHQQFTANTPYDQMVRSILTVPVASGNRREFAAVVMGGGEEASPLGFYMAKDAKPENLAASTARLFLGVRIECAQCHDHPKQKWTREHFWGQAAFFAGIQRQNQGDFFGAIRELPDRRELSIPGTERVAQAAFLDGSEPQWKYKVGARVTLADWITTADNPYFARATVNRVWSQFFGHGFVEPVDDFNPENLPSHPELLDELARQFAANKFDLKFLIRAITLSKAYQLASGSGKAASDDARLFSHMALKSMTPEQLFDSFAQASGYRDPTPASQRAFAFGTARNDFLSKFSAPEKRTDFRMSIPQALSMMNSRLVQEATSVESSSALAALIDAPFLDTRGRIEAIYLATLSRKPTTDELARFVKYVDGGGPKKDPKRALADVMWALLNSTEFILNH